MSGYKFTEQAEQDFDAIVDYTLENWGPLQATKYVDELEALLARLVLTPALGLNQDHLFKGLLSFPYVSHVVYFVQDADGITVIRLLHKRMDTKKHILVAQKIQGLKS